jgi:hypothetical protein
VPTIYDPNAENSEEEKVFAARWELLRRNREFIGVAEKWICSSDYRRVFSASPDYHNLAVHRPRCALDWMLTPRERHELAKVQIPALRWMYEQRFNFGPIICRLKAPAVTARNRDHLISLFEVRPLQTRAPVLHLDDDWRHCPAGFKRQFRLACAEPMDCEAINGQLDDISKWMNQAAQKIGTGDECGEAVYIAVRLSEIATRLRRLAEFSIVFSFPKRRIPERIFRSWIHLLRQAHTEMQLIEPTSKYDRHKSFLGTAEDWRWFLQAERLGLDVKRSRDLSKLAHVYSEDLRAMNLLGKARNTVKSHGFSGSAVPKAVVRNRRSTVKKHVRSIEHWINQQYPPAREAGNSR